MCWCEWSLQTGMGTGSVEVRQVEAGTGSIGAVAVAALVAVAAAEGWTNGSSCLHPGLTEASAGIDEVQKAVHIGLAAGESAYEDPKVGHTGSVAVVEVYIGIVVAGRKREGIVHSRN